MKTKRKANEFVISYCVMSSDEDQIVVEDLIVGINANAELIVRVEHNDYEDARYNCSTQAVVSEDNARKLSRRLNVPLIKLPRFISDFMCDWGEMVNAGCVDVQACFSDILERLLDEGCKFRIKRQPGFCGHICC